MYVYVCMDVCPHTTEDSLTTFRVDVTGTLTVGFFLSGCEVVPRSKDIGQGKDWRMSRMSENPVLTGGTPPCMAAGQQKEIMVLTAVPVTVPISFPITVPIADASVVGTGRRFQRTCEPELTLARRESE